MDVTAAARSAETIAVRTTLSSDFPRATFQRFDRGISSWTRWELTWKGEGHARLNGEEIDGKRSTRPKSFREESGAVASYVT